MHSPWRRLQPSILWKVCKSFRAGQLPYFDSDGGSHSLERRDDGTHALVAILNRLLVASPKPVQKLFNAARIFNDRCLTLQIVLRTNCQLSHEVNKHSEAYACGCRNRITKNDCSYFIWRNFSAAVRDCQFTVWERKTKFCVTVEERHEEKVNILSGLRHWPRFDSNWYSDSHPWYGRYFEITTYGSPHRRWDRRLERL